MSENDNQQPLATVFCKNGCGFYGSNQFDGLCSVCFKQAMSNGQAQDAAVDGRPIPSIIMQSAASSVDVAGEPSASLPPNSSASSFISVNSSDASATESADSQQQQQSASSSGASRRRNRCETCKKKVGLTGFECRCGGVYCSVHRYSDKHGCQFDYQGQGQAEIRKANPLVVKSKVDKL